MAGQSECTLLVKSIAQIFRRMKWKQTQALRGALSQKTHQHQTWASAGGMLKRNPGEKNFATKAFELTQQSADWLKQPAKIHFAF